MDYQNFYNYSVIALIAIIVLGIFQAGLESFGFNKFARCVEKVCTFLYVILTVLIAGGLYIQSGGI